MAQLINDASDTKSHLVTRAALRAIFAQAQPSIGDNLPPELMRAIDSPKKEQVLGITQVGLAQLLDIGLSQPSLKLAVRRLDRGYHEYFGQQFQVVTAACIHDATRVLLLRLNRTQDVEGYHVGTLTYPQGHVQYTEKFTNDYFTSKSGFPSIQHSLEVMALVLQNDLPLLVQLMCHNPAILYQVDRRGFLREGYHADLVLVDTNAPHRISSDDDYSKCGWTPYDGLDVPARVTHTFINGNLVYENGLLHEEHRGQRLLFNR